jgi:hypothetical protein
MLPQSVIVSRKASKPYMTLIVKHDRDVCHKRYSGNVWDYYFINRVICAIGR